MNAGATARGGFALLTAAILAATGCTPEAAPPRTQQAYLWQRLWTPDTIDLQQLSRAKLDGLLVLAAEIETAPDGGLRLVKPAVDWPKLVKSGLPLRAAIRLPRPGREAAWQSLGILTEATLRDLLPAIETRTEAELQIDFDCPQKSLSRYRDLLLRLRAVLPPGWKLTITALPIWLEEPEWTSLAKVTDGFVLQVHSVTMDASQPERLCDPAQVLLWVTRAEAAGVPFWVALPTYTTWVGRSPEGDLRGVVSDGIRPRWPPDTAVQVFAADPAEMGRLRTVLMTQPSSHLRGVIWYRLPVGRQEGNWSWAAFSKVLDGRITRSLPVIRQSEGTAVRDLCLDYQDTLPGYLPPLIEVTWPKDARCIAADGVGGYHAEKSQPQFLRFVLSEDMIRSRHQEEGRWPVGWLRLEPANTALHVRIVD
ncbi:MAG: DUF3142 domain-containing protein [Verrucomicrobiales bacterium]|nr:DUF3142 domain-containing protein [Verrucomicrobiales bacterium]